MGSNDSFSVFESMAKAAGKTLFELGPALPLEFGIATLPFPRAIFRELYKPQFPTFEQVCTEALSRSLPPPPAPKVLASPPLPTRPTTTSIPIIERRGI